MKPRVYASSFTNRRTPPPRTCLRVCVPYPRAGYFYEPLETLETMNFEEELKMIDICAVGPLRVSAALVNAGQGQGDARHARPIIFVCSLN